MTTSRRSFASSFLALAALLGSAGIGHAQDAPATSTAPAPESAPTPTPSAAPTRDAPPPTPPAASEPPPAPAPWDALPPVSTTNPTGEEKLQGHPGFALNLSIGYSVPLGDATSAEGDSLSASFTGQVPVSLEMGGNVTPSLFLGVYGTYAFGGVASQIQVCQPSSGIDCSAHSLHAGLAIAYRFLPDETIRPWVGYGVGYESQTIGLSQSTTGETGSLGLTGWEFGHFKAGIDVQVSDALAVGPFIDAGLGKYGHAHSEDPTQTSDADIQNTALHGWFTIGFRTAITP